MLASIILVKQLTYNKHSLCANNILVDNDQYNFCQKAKSINNQKIANEMYFLQNSKSQLFMNTDLTQKSVIDLQVYNYNVNIFVLFGLGSGSQNVADSEINISLNFPVFQGALICLQCNVQVTNCTLVFVATGKAVSCVLGEALNDVSIQQTFIQFRISSSNSSGIVNKVSNSLVNFSITDCKLTGGNLIESGYNGYISSFVLMSISILVDSFQVCVGNTSSFGNQSAIISQSEAEVHFCDMCGAQFVVYGLCLDSLNHGTQTGGVLQCDYPFIFLNNRCSCDQGYVLDQLTCVNILQALLNVTNTDTSALQKRVDDVATGLLDLDTRIYNNASELHAQIGNSQSDLESQISSNISMLNNEIQTNILALENSIVGNASSLLNSIQLTRDALEKYIIDNATVLDWRIYYNFTSLKQTLDNISQQFQNNLSNIQLNFSALYLNFADFKYNQSLQVTQMQSNYSQKISDLNDIFISLTNQVSCTNVIGQQFINGQCQNASCSVSGQMRLNGICLCSNVNAIIQGNACVCPLNSILIGSICTCPDNSNVVNDQCTCNVPGQIMVNGVCVCQTIGAFFDGSACTCGINSTNITDTCGCPQNSILQSGVCQCTIIPEQIMENGICVCLTKNAYYNGYACACGINALNNSNICSCPTNSNFVNGECTCNQISGQTMVNGTCSCSTIGAFITGSACTCGVDSLNISNTCFCPTYSNLVAGVCICNVITGQSMQQGECKCQQGQTVFNGSCQAVIIISSSNLQCVQSYFVSTFDIQSVTHQIADFSNFSTGYVFSSTQVIQNAFVDISDNVYTTYVQPLFQLQTTINNLKIQLGTQSSLNGSFIMSPNSFITLNYIKIISKLDSQLTVNAASCLNIISSFIGSTKINNLLINISFVPSSGNITLVSNINGDFNISGYQVLGDYISTKTVAMIGINIDYGNIKIDKVTFQPNTYNVGNGSSYLFGNAISSKSIFVANNIAIIIGNTSYVQLLGSISTTSYNANYYMFGGILTYMSSKSTISVQNFILDSYQELNSSLISNSGIIVGLQEGQGNIIIQNMCMQQQIKSTSTFTRFGLIGTIFYGDVSIQNVSITLSAQGAELNYFGLIGHQTEYSLKADMINLKISIFINSILGYCVGSLYGKQEASLYGIIQNTSIVGGNISLDSSNTGGFIGFAMSMNVTIENSSISQTNINSNSNNGGFIGFSGFSIIITIQNSSICQTNISSSYKIGGFIGNSFSQFMLTNSTISISNISGIDSIGGFIGQFSQSTFSLINSKITQVCLFGTSNIGITIGINYGTLAITNSLSASNYINVIIQNDCLTLSNIWSIVGC
ncbi:Conserved_hypothetical protein [Hexamita inflata]|uniref:Uncharacterized protein n=1 Tax=Hexamita inflata TaxID=28002 RepID=A0ABP1GX41_9EUKA